MNVENKLYGIKNVNGLWLCHDAESGDTFWSGWAAHATFYSRLETAEKQLAYYTSCFTGTRALPFRIVSGSFVED